MTAPTTWKLAAAEPGEGRGHYLVGKQRAEVLHAAQHQRGVPQGGHASPVRHQRQIHRAHDGRGLAGPSQGLQVRKRQLRRVIVGFLERVFKAITTKVFWGF